MNQAFIRLQRIAQVMSTCATRRASSTWRSADLRLLVCRARSTLPDDTCCNQKDRRPLRFLLSNYLQLINDTSGSLGIRAKSTPIDKSRHTLHASPHQMTLQKGWKKTQRLAPQGECEAVAQDVLKSASSGTDSLRYTEQCAKILRGVLEVRLFYLTRALR